MSSGGVNSANAETVKLYSTGFTDKNNGDCAWDSENKQYSWEATSNNTIRMISFEAGVLSQFSKLHVKWTGLTEGASIRILIPNPDGDGNYQFISSDTDGDIDLGINTDFAYQWGGGLLDADKVSRVTQIRIGGSDGTLPASMDIAPANIYLETSWEAPMQISSTADWTVFSLLVKNGLPSLNAKLTANIEVTDGTMIGIGSNDSGSENPKAYSGTFDGQNYTVTYNSPKTTEKVTAPFRFVKGVLS